MVPWYISSHDGCTKIAYVDVFLLYFTTKQSEYRVYFYHSWHGVFWWLHEPIPFDEHPIEYSELLYIVIWWVPLFPHVLPAKKIDKKYILYFDDKQKLATSVYLVQWVCRIDDKLSFPVVWNTRNNFKLLKYIDIWITYDSFASCNEKEIICIQPF